MVRPNLRPVTDNSEPPDEGGGDGLSGRVERLEKEMGEVRNILHRLEPLIARIDERIRDMPSAKEFGEVKGRIASMPTTWQMVLIFMAVLGSFFAILNYALPLLK